MMFEFDLTRLPMPVLIISEILKPAKTYVVGGILRDAILLAQQRGETVIKETAGGDWDMATPHPPKEVLKRLRKAKIAAVPIGIEHGTIAAIIDEKQYEITTFRYDLKYPDGRHPVVQFADSIEEDLQRRDFTVNAFALDIDTGTILDRFGGAEDLQARRIRTVGDPEIRFREDYLRMLRAARFAAKLEGEIDGETFAAMRRSAALISGISAERIRDELMKMLTYPKPSHGFLLLHQCGLLQYILPELEAGFDVRQNRYHSHDVAMHILLSVDALPQDYPLDRFATLMHDLGKVQAKQYQPVKDDYVFYGHQYISKKMTKRIMRRLRFSNKEIETTSAIVENHMYNLKPDLSLPAARRFLRKLGRENVEGFLRMRMADRKGNQFNADGYEKGIFHFLRTVRAIDRAEDALTVRDLAISGYDLIQMGLTPGPVFSVILDQLLEEIIDDPSLNNREWLLERANGFAEEYWKTGTIAIPEKAPIPDEEKEE